MSGGVLVLAEMRRGELRDVTRELIGAGRALKGRLGGVMRVAVVAGEPAAYADQVALEGVDELLAIKAPTDHFEPHVTEQALAAVIERERPALVLLAHSVDGLGCGPALAARLGLGFASDVTAIDCTGDLVATRGAYGDKLQVQLEFPGKEHVLLMLRPGEFEPAAGIGSPPLRELAVEFGDVPTEHLGFREADGGGVDISKADFLVSIGRAIEDQEDVVVFERLADAAGATLTASRPLVDAGWLPPARLVGQSGKTVRPKVYLALGISGAVQHLAGMQKAETIVAVNRDPEAPIFHVAHYGAVADIFEIADELQKRLA